MSRIKTATTALTAAVLVTGIGLAVAQTDDQNQPAEPMAAATASPISEQTPADPNAQVQQAQQVDTTAAPMTQQTPPPVDNTTRTTPPMDSTTALPSETPMRSANDTTTRPTTDSTGSYQPAPRADRN